MNRLLSLLCLLLACTASAAHASGPVTFSFDGCTDAANQPIASRAEPSLPTLFEVRNVEGKPVIFYSPLQMPHLLPETRAFLFAHECGRLRLQLPSSGERTLEQAERADCWAANTLLRSGLIKDASGFDAIAADLSMVGEQWMRLPGPAREVKLANCSSVKGGVALPQGQTASQQWNNCMQACGSRLYACGRSNECMSSFNQCTAKCGSK